jgi:hypothetical protein
VLAPNVESDRLEVRARFWSPECPGHPCRRFNAQLLIDNAF